MKPSRTMKLTGIACTASATIEFLAAVWWWALFGMSESVSVAHGATVTILVVVGFGLIMESGLRAQHAEF